MICFPQAVSLHWLQRKEAEQTFPACTPARAVCLAPGLHCQLRGHVVEADLAEGRQCKWKRLWLSHCGFEGQHLSWGVMGSKPTDVGLEVGMK